MQIVQIKTRDLWQSAYILAKGGRLRELRSDPNNGRFVTFILDGENIFRLRSEFTSGQASCNVAQLRASMLHLKSELSRILNEPAEQQKY